MLFGIVLSTMAIAVTTNALAKELSGKITVWSWNIGAKSLEVNVLGFNAKHHDVEVFVELIGNQQVFDHQLAACAAGGGRLPDVFFYRKRRS